MNESRYRAILDERRLRFGPPLLSDDVGAAILSRAARALRSREAAQRAWHELTTSDWRSDARVAAMVQGVLTIETASAVVAARIQRDAEALRRALAARLPGLQRVRVLNLATPRGDAAPGEEAE